jgi:hypothetical protein
MASSLSSAEGVGEGVAAGTGYGTVADLLHAAAVASGRDASPRAGVQLPIAATADVDHPSWGGGHSRGSTTFGLG